MKKIAGDTGINNQQTNIVPGLAPEDNSPAEHLALHLAGANGTHAVSYCTEAGLFQQIGIPAIICGPGSIEQAHKPDEYIDISEMQKCEVFMKRRLPLGALPLREGVSRPRVPIVSGVKAVGRRAEFADDLDLAILDHVLAVFIGKALSASSAPHPASRCSAG